MARAQTKKDLLSSAKTNFEKLVTMIDNLSEDELNTDFDFTNDIKKKEAHWKRDKNLRDVLIHLYEWHQLLINWVKRNQSGEFTKFLPSPYNWKTYGEMNYEFLKKHASTTLEESKELLLSSHKKVLEIIDSFSNEELFTKNHFNWTGGSTVGSYCVSATASHYDWAMKKLRAHKKVLK